VYQQIFSDAFAALLDLSPGDSHPMVYLYCLEEAMQADGQLGDVLMPAHQVVMDSSVPWDILNMDALKVAAGNTGSVQSTQLQRRQAGRLYTCNSREASQVRTNDADFRRAASAFEMQRGMSVSDFFGQEDFTTPSFRHLKSPVRPSVSDPFNLLVDHDNDHNRSKRELHTRGNILRIPDRNRSA
jgi:hypothetical protein